MNQAMTAQAQAVASRSFFLKTWTVRCSTTPKDGIEGRSFRIAAGPTADTVRFDFPEDFDSEHRFQNLTQGIFDASSGLVRGTLDDFEIKIGKGAPDIAGCDLREDRAIRGHVSRLEGQAPGEFGAEEGG